MSQEQNNNNQNMDAPEELEFSSEDFEYFNKQNKKVDEKITWDTYSDNYNEKKEQYESTNKNYERIHKNQFKGKDKFEIYKQSYLESLKYYGNLKDYLLLAEMDNSDAILKYNYYKKMYARMMAFIPLHDDFKVNKATEKSEHPTWEEWCNFNNKRKIRKAHHKCLEAKKKEMEKPKKNN